MFYLAFSIYAIIIAGYVLFSIALLYHVDRYIPESGPGPWVTRVYILLALAAVSASLYFFFQVPWDIINFL